MSDYDTFAWCEVRMILGGADVFRVLLTWRYGFCLRADVCATRVATRTYIVPRKYKDGINHLGQVVWINSKTMPRKSKERGDKYGPRGTKRGGLRMIGGWAGEDEPRGRKPLDRSHKNKGVFTDFEM
eukprot:1196253-Prorocentrum_minimum.AAC.5